MIHRTISNKINQLINQYPIVSIIGPRQSGKTTLVKALFPDWKYVSLEDLDMREFAQSDPRGFLSTYKEHSILDEVQRVPGLFSYLQTKVDSIGKEGLYILTGSFNFGLMEGISQSLAGRVSIVNLLPFSLTELIDGGLAPENLDNLLFSGLYPRIHDKKNPPNEWYADYVKTYIERDVRMITKISDLSTFQKFIKMCAARSGQIINLSALGDDCGISHNTAKSWMSILESSFIIFLLKPYYKNFNKRLVKNPKLYFYDTGVLCYLLGIDNPQNLAIHSQRGHIFETWGICELMKGIFNRRLSENIYFWRDNAGHEIDCIFDQEGGSFIPIEFKSGETLSLDSFKGLKHWYKISDTPPQNGFLVYAGSIDQIREYGKVLGWRSFSQKIPLEI
ncbi:MAG: ATP-binding protein [Desulfobacterales bacterium]|nr:ATP-binding protein [Desulfobacterales bacterium]MBF0395586.1 ATP-binding protein [Desulfobacterales bacterium]